MKTKRNKSFPSTAAGLGSRKVRFELIDATAGAVCVAGSFNDWHPRSSPMLNVGDGRWVKDVTLVPGTYEYLFVVDDRWVPDPNAKDTVANPFGGRNSRLEVT